MKLTRPAFPLVTLLCATAAAAEDRCVDGHYVLPVSIAEEMRPYLVCGLIVGRDGHVPVRLNGQTVRITGGASQSCERIRSTALQASEVKLAVTIPDAISRRTFVLAEFEKVDQFLRRAAHSYELALGDWMASSQCGTSHASN